MAVATRSKTDRIRALNDQLRKTFVGGKVMLTSGVAVLPPELLVKISAAVKAFEHFDDGNDPHKEHDFLSVNVEGTEIFAKVDYYDKELKFGSEDPSDPAKTTRVLTIMLASEY
jgi:hypothetical protein